ncbi:MAG TPA: phosphoglycerate kinase, partial [Acidimicrobiales bacterium]|nr:phosphoglycerate kinase [Acidimicrobiales bacterium]
MELPELEDLGDLAGRSVLVRCDFNVPLAGGEIQDDLRIRASLPTLSYLVDAGAQVTACSHLGRPNGEPDPEFSMEPVRRRLADLAPGVGLLENLRFDPGETCNSATFGEALVEGHDAYVNDAFGASHRSHASVVGPPMFLPSAAGRLLAREVRVLGNLRAAPRRPFLAILGGAKV